MVGQEYTDFDKGLDDGIEGDIFGFNLVLSATSGSLKFPQTSPFRRKYQNVHSQRFPQQHFNPKPQQPLIFGSGQTEGYKTILDEDSIAPDSQGYAMIEPSRSPKGLLDIFRNFFGEEPSTSVRVIKKYPQNMYKVNNRRSSINDIGDVKKPLGLLLVELSFDCGLRKGAPLSGKNVIVNWNQSPVRVFGGAILKTIPAFCYEKSIQ